MKIKDIDITEALRDALPVDSYLFNPSMAHVTGDTFIVSVRSYVHNVTQPLDPNPKLLQNPQHPWGTDWAGTDVTYILPVVIVEDNIQPITSGQWPLAIPVQDMRVYRFMKDDRHVAFVLTYNERYEGYEDMIIKGGDSCDDYCYLIGWSYLLVDINSLDYSYVPGEKPLCANISNPVEKNWSLWRYDHEDKVYLFVSYALTPLQSAFSLLIKGIKDGELAGGSNCRMITVRSTKNDNILGDLEKYYDNKLLVSLSTPSYEIEVGKYQAVGHLKVKIDYINKLSKGKKTTPLAKFARKYVSGRGKKHFNPNYIYMMFIYRFKIIDIKDEQIKIEQGSGIIELTGSDNRVYALVTHVTPAFVCKVSEYDYFLNFPSGMVLTEDHTIISYGDGDAESHLMYFSNEQLEEFLKPVAELSADSFEFLHGTKNAAGMITL